MRTWLFAGKCVISLLFLILAGLKYHDSHSASAVFDRPLGTWTNQRTGATTFADAAASIAADNASITAQYGVCTLHEQYNFSVTATQSIFQNRHGYSGDHNYCGSITHASNFAACPSGSAAGPANGQCQCSTSGHVWNGSACAAPPPTCVSGAHSTTGTFDIGTSPQNNIVASSSAAPFCSAGCAQTFSSSSTASARALVGGVYHYYAVSTVSDSGANCTTGAATPATGVPNPTCAAGQVLGTFNGVSMCLASGSGNPVNPNAAPTVPAGSVTTVNPPSAPNGAGNTTQVTTNVTAGANGTPSKQTTTTETRDSAGKLLSSVTTEDTPTDPLKGFCEENPSASICSKSSFAGTCGAVPACGGDAVQCATAAAVFKLQCDLSTTSASAVLGAQLGTAGDPLASTLPTAANATSIDMSASISSASFWGSSCPANQTVPLGGLSFVIPWSTVCPVFTMMGFILIGLTGLVCARIVGVFA